MNEQIRELAIKAGARERSICHGHGDYRTELIMSDEIIERFADLMLKASFDAAINDGRFHDARGILRAGKYTAMEHFGVEE